jgi:hypothetical protein
VVFEPISGALTGIVLSAIAGEVVGRPTNALLDAVLRSNAEQISLLKRIDQNVDDLLRGPFNAGLAWLDEARRPHRSSDERRQDLENARRSFIDAIGNEQRDPARNAVIKSYLAFTAVADNDFVAAEDYLEDAHEVLKSSYVATMRATTFWSARREPVDLAALRECFDGISDLRVALGAHYDSVPRYLLSGWHLPGLRGRSDGDDEWLTTESWRKTGLIWRAGQRDRPSRVHSYLLADLPAEAVRGRGRIAANHSDPVFGSLDSGGRGGYLSSIWDTALPTRTNELIEVVTGGDIGQMLHGTFVGAMVPDDWAIVARDMAADRRSGWPVEQKDALPAEVREALWSPTFTPKAKFAFDEHMPRMRELAGRSPNFGRYPKMSRNPRKRH